MQARHLSSPRVSVSIVVAQKSDSLQRFLALLWQELDHVRHQELLQVRAMMELVQSALNNALGGKPCV